MKLKKMLKYALNLLYKLVWDKPFEESEATDTLMANQTEIRERVKLLAEGFSIHSKHSNRIWLSLILLLLFSLIAHTNGPNDESNMKFLGQSVAESWFYFWSTLVSTTLYFVFCSAYMQAHRAAEKFNIFLDKDKGGIGELTFYGKVKWGDAAHMLYHPTFVRMHTITREIPFKILRILFWAIFRPITVTIYLLMPPIIIITCNLTQDRLCWILERDWNETYWNAFYYFVLCIIIFPALPLVRRELKWYISRFKDL